MKTLLVMVGFPRAGKTTWAKMQNAPIVNPDSIRLALTGQAFFGPAEHMVWATAHLMVEALLNVHDTVILDSTNVTKARRSVWKSPRWRTLYVHVPTPWQTCYGRAGMQGKHDLRDVIDRMAQEWEPLGADEERFQMAPSVEPLSDK